MAVRKAKNVAKIERKTVAEKNGVVQCGDVNLIKGNPKTCSNPVGD
jgi:hypothetical protein